MTAGANAILTRNAASISEAESTNSHRLREDVARSASTNTPIDANVRQARITSLVIVVLLTMLNGSNANSRAHHTAAAGSISLRTKKKTSAVVTIDATNTGATTPRSVWPKIAMPAANRYSSNGRYAY